MSDLIEDLQSTADGIAMGGELHPEDSNDVMRMCYAALTHLRELESGVCVSAEAVEEASDAFKELLAEAERMAPPKDNGAGFRARRIAYCEKWLGYFQNIALSRQGDDDANRS